MVRKLPHKKLRLRLLKVTTLSSFRYIRKTKQSFVKLIWISVIVLFASATIFTTMTFWDSIIAKPTVVSLEHINYPVNQAPFPAISICNLNKISRRKAENWTSIISQKTKLTRKTILEYIKSLGSFYNVDQPSKGIEFTKLLETYFPDVKIVDLVAMLAPSCEDLLVECFWKNDKINCSDYFQTRLTFEGYCCLFNYVKETNEKIDENFRSRQILHGVSGFEFGLEIEVNNDFSDYFYARHNSLGVHLHIFNPTDYPDKNSGSLNEQLVGFSKLAFMQLEVIGYHSVSDVVEYATEQRQCYFSYEQTTHFGVYSESDCLMDCRVDSMISLCDCVPFMIPQNQSSVCTMLDTPCLQKYKLKWQSLSPTDTFLNENLLRETYNALNCHKRCYPLCNSFRYEVGTTFVPIEKSYGNNSMIRIFYNPRHSFLYKQDVYIYWFEFLSRVGSITFTFMGISFIALLEIIVYCVVKLHSVVTLESVFGDELCFWEI